MSITRKDLYKKNQAVDQLKKTSPDAIKLISSYLTYSEKLNFFSSSQYLFTSLKDGFKSLEPMFDSLRLNALVKKAAEGIKEYRTRIYKEAVHQNKKKWNFYKGCHRSLCFYDMLTDEGNRIQDRMFGLYVLLRESNGKLLKSMVHDKLVLNFGKAYFGMVEGVVQKAFSAEGIIRREKELLIIIHKWAPERIFDLDKESEVGFMRAFIENMSHEQNEEIQHAAHEKSCAIS